MFTWFEQQQQEQLLLVDAALEPQLAPGALALLPNMAMAAAAAVPAAAGRAAGNPAAAAGAAAPVYARHGKVDGRDNDTAESDKEAVDKKVKRSRWVMPPRDMRSQGMAFLTLCWYDKLG
jgi:hypothetical protein